MKQESLEQRTERDYKLTIKDWIPVYSIARTITALYKKQPNILTHEGENEYIGFFNLLYQVATTTVAGLKILDYLLK